MTKSTRMLILGFAGGLVLVLAAIGIYFLLAQATGVDFSVRFQNAKGLNPGDKVLLNGVEVGQVKAVRLTDTGVEVAAHLESDFAAQVRADSRAVVKGSGMNPFGDKSLELLPPSNNDPAQPIRSGMMLDGIENEVERGAWQLGQVLSEGSKIFSQQLEELGRAFEDVSRQFEDLGNSPEVQKLKQDMDHFVNRVEHSTDKAQRQATERDWPELRARMEAQARDLEAKGRAAAAEKLRQAREQLDKTMQKVDQAR